MRLDDPLLERFLHSAVHCAIMSFSEDDTIIPETVDFDNFDFGYNGANLSASGEGPASRPAVSAAEMANAILNPRVASARAPSTPSKEPMPAALAALYPFVFRSYTLDRDAFAVIEWTNCSAANLWTILTSEHLFVGASKSTACMLTFAIKNQLLGNLQHFLGAARVNGIKAQITNRGINVTRDLERLFLECCDVSGVLPALASALATYNMDNHVIRFKPGVLPEVSEVQQWTARLAACMVEPCLQEFFQSMCNANPGRLAVHEPDLRITSSKQRIVERITNDYLNNAAFIPHSNASVSAWCDTDFDSSVLGKERRSWVWTAQRIQFIKTGMTRLMANFNKSGDLVNDEDHVARDLEFFEKFAKRDALWFWIYLCWNHGTNIPVWNLTLLPEGESFDVGGQDHEESAVGGSSSSSSSKKGKKRGRYEDDDAFTSSVTGLVEVSRRALDCLINSQNSQSTATVAHHHYPPQSPCSSQQTNIFSPTNVLSPEKKRAADLCAFKEQLSELVEMKKLLPGDMQGPVDECISKVTSQVHGLVCVSVEDLTA
jgi:hypothetical protein